MNGSAVRRALTRRGRHIPIAVLAVATVANRSVWPVTVAVIAVLVLDALLDLADRVSAEGDDLAVARDLYVQGDIPLPEFERRVEFILDEDAQQIREVVEEINGVGPETSAALAAEFRDMDALASAPREDLQQAAGVGEQTAEDVAAYLRGGRA
jgi:hypothetical protein